MTESWRVALTIKNKMHFQANVYPRPDHMLDESCKLWILAAKNPRKVGAVKSLVNESRKEGDSVACGASRREVLTTKHRPLLECVADHSFEPPGRCGTECVCSREGR